VIVNAEQEQRHEPEQIEMCVRGQRDMVPRNGHLETPDHPGENEHDGSLEAEGRRFHKPTLPKIDAPLRIFKIQARKPSPQACSRILAYLGRFQRRAASSIRLVGAQQEPIGSIRI
jgi:hypothetical protein